MANEFKTQRARFNDSKGGLLVIQAKQMKDGTYQVVAYHTPKGQPRTRGCVGVFNEDEAAIKRFSTLCTEAEKNKWSRKVRKNAGSSAFDTLPKAP